MSNNLNLAGAQSARPTRYAPIWTNRFSQGLWTQRNPLRDAAATRMEERYYGQRGDAMIDGRNVEITNRLTVQRRPGNSVYNSQTFTNVGSFYEFRLFDRSTEQIRVMVDQADALYDGTGPSTKELIWTKSTGAGQTYMQYVANTLYFGNGVDQKKWMNTLKTWQASTAYALDNMQTFVRDGSGNVQQAQCCIFPITNVAVSSSVVTITSSEALEDLISPDLVIVPTVATATWLNGEKLTVTAVDGYTFTADFAHADYSASDTGTAVVLAGGSPQSGLSEPSWNSTLGGTTDDGTIRWVNRGNPIQNWGIVEPDTAPAVNVGASNVSWQPNTFYSNSNVIVDSNGNLQQLTTGGVSGESAPAWATSVGSTTADGAVVWTMLQTAASLTWQAHTEYDANHFLVATAGGVPCLFQLGKVQGVRFDGDVHAYLWNEADSGPVGAFARYYPLSTSSADASATGNSLRFNDSTSSAKPALWTTLNASGEVTGYTTPFPGRSDNYSLVVLADLVIPAAGQYSFNTYHHDGMIWGVGNGAQKVKGTGTDLMGHTKTAVRGYDIMGGANGNGLSSGQYTNDKFVVNFPTAGTYPIEIDFKYWKNVSMTLTFFINNVSPVPGDPTSAATSPLWPAWTTTYAPDYPSVSESENTLTWYNLGPAADYSWHSRTQYITVPTILDPNGSSQQPYRAGVTGTAIPTFATGIYALTKDNPDLTWINVGPASAPPSGTLSAYNGGWQYCLALVNTLDNTVSNAGPLTPATGNFVGSTGVTLTGGIPADYDSQADYVAIFRTKDGGATPFLVPGDGNTVYTLPLSEYLANGYVDTTPDSGLNILLQPALSKENTPPPVGLVNLTYHISRILGSVGNTVVWSSGPDSPIGNGNQGFNPINYATFPSSVKRIVPTSIGALVFTVSDIYLIQGQGTSSSPLLPTPYGQGIGLLSYNAMSINGTLIYFFTSDSQLLAITPDGGYSEIGSPIGDQFELDNWDPSSAYVAFHISGSQDKALYVADGSTGWFRMSLSAAPESGQPWSPFAGIVGGCKAVRSVEVLPGVHKLLLGPTGSGPILQRDLDEFADNDQPYPANFTIGSLVLALPGQIAELGFITTDSTAAGSKPVISVLRNEISGPFEPMPRSVDDPPQLEASKTTYAQRFYFSQTELPALCRHMQIRVDWPSENAKNELLSLTIFGGYAQER